MKNVNIALKIISDQLNKFSREVAFWLLLALFVGDTLGILDFKVEWIGF